jgi:hypothetical protein
LSVAVTRIRERVPHAARREVEKQKNCRHESGFSQRAQKAPSTCAFESIRDAGLCAGF